MDIQCPNCKNSFLVVLENFDMNASVETHCAHCKSKFRISMCLQLISGPTQSVVELSAENPSFLTQRQGFSGGNELTAATENKVVIAIDGEASRQVIRDILNREGFIVVEALDGQNALDLLQKEKPSVALLDVGLPQMFGLEICDIIKKSPSLNRIGVMLVASIYDKSRYKRQPSNLYGADDFIERHQFETDLVPKVKQLIFKNKGEDTDSLTQSIPPTPPPAEASIPENGAEPISNQTENLTSDPVPSLDGEQQAAETPRVEPVENTPPFSLSQEQPQAPESSPLHDAAQRLARIIISDIALYNQKNVEEGLRQGNFTEALKSELEEGKKLYRERVSPEILNSTNYFETAVQEFISKRTSMVQ